jgi:hypothetical protein
VDRALLLWLTCLLALGVAAPADIYRCEDPDGSVRFADDSSHCPEAQRLRSGPDEGEGRAPALPAGPAQGEADVRSQGRTAPEVPLEEILLPAARVAGRWEVVNEVPIDPAEDPDLLRWGVRAQRARHYTRSYEAGVQVCSVEIWGFADATRARLAHENLRYPDWQFERLEHLLIMLHAVTYSRREPPRREVFADCRRLGSLTSARAANRLRR